MVNEWKRARCDSGASCVEVLDNFGTMLVRNTNDPSHFVTFDVEEWTHFIDAVKRGEFDS